jgi:hypothetical protein
MRLISMVLSGSLGVSAVGCGSTPPTTPQGPAVLQVAGQYQIVQQGVETTCGDAGATIPSVTATVTHAPGAEAFTMRDTGGTTFNGTVQPNGDFTSTATFGPDASGNTFTQRLQGRFSTGGFTGRLEVGVQPRACAFARNWTATKQGSPNVIP